VSPSGGRRKGAGRPPERHPRVTLAVRVEEATKRRLVALAILHGMSQGQVIDQLVRDAAGG
jgi:predicted HicB family RNase H-like nuclease